MKNKAAILLLSFSTFILGFYSLSPAGPSDPSSCVGCHTDEAALKRLYQPPKDKPGGASVEGEG